MKAILVGTLLLFNLAAHAADPKGTTAMDPKQAEMMKAMQDYGTPGEPHKVLATLAGKWKYTSKFWMKDGEKPEESIGTSSFKMILGGRFLQQDVTGKAMNMPFKGMGLTAYDNVKKEYQTVWLDSMGTGIMRGTGSYDTATKTITDKGTYSCPITKGERQYRSEWKITDKNNMTFSMFGPGIDDPKEFKQMEMVFKRTQ